MTKSLISSLLILFILIQIGNAQDQENTIFIPADQWTNSTVSVSSGERICIWGFGWACFNSNTNRNLSFAGPGGIPSFNSSHPVGNAPTYCLIAKIGSAGTPFGVGTYTEFAAGSSGDLYFSVNDPFLSDNQGLFTAIVARNGSLWPNIPGSIVDDEDSSQPRDYSLDQNYPNPFNPLTTINYSVEVPGEVTLKIYNSLGQQVRTLINEEKSPGEYTIVWDGTSDNGLRVATGTYFYQLQAGERIEAKKMILLK